MFPELSSTPDCASLSNFDPPIRAVTQPLWFAPNVVSIEPSSLKRATTNCLSLVWPTTTVLPSDWTTASRETTLMPLGRSSVAMPPANVVSSAPALNSSLDSRDSNWQLDRVGMTGLRLAGEARGAFKIRGFTTSYLERRYDPRG